MQSTYKYKKPLYVLYIFHTYTIHIAHSGNYNIYSQILYKNHYTLWEKPEWHKNPQNNKCNHTYPNRAPIEFTSLY